MRVFILLCLIVVAVANNLPNGYYIMNRSPSRTRRQDDDSNQSSFFSGLRSFDFRSLWPFGRSRRQTNQNNQASFPPEINVLPAGAINNFLGGPSGFNALDQGLGIPSQSFAQQHLGIGNDLTSLTLQDLQGSSFPGLQFGQQQFGLGGSQLAGAERFRQDQNLPFPVQAAVQHLLSRPYFTNMEFANSAVPSQFGGLGGGFGGGISPFVPQSTGAFGFSNAGTQVASSRLYTPEYADSDSLSNSQSSDAFNNQRKERKCSNICQDRYGNKRCCD